jgi:hypothetical protein
MSNQSHTKNSLDKGSISSQKREIQKSTLLVLERKELTNLNLIPLFLNIMDLMNWFMILLFGFGNVQSVWLWIIKWKIARIEFDVVVVTAMGTRKGISLTN